MGFNRNQNKPYQINNNKENITAVFLRDLHFCYDTLPKRNNNYKIIFKMALEFYHDT